MLCVWVSSRISVGGSVIDPSTAEELEVTAKLFGLEPDALVEALTTRVMTTKGGGVKGTVIGYVSMIHFQGEMS